MKLNQIAPNQTELILANGTVVFFSYDTAVCVDTGEEILRTEKKYSVTTSRHINSWLDGRRAKLVSQSEINRFAENS